MFERFSDRARRVIVHAQEQSRLFDHSYIDTEHLLLAVATQGDGASVRVLHALGIETDAVQREVTAITGPTPTRLRGPPSGHIPFTDRAKTVLELAHDEALDLGHTYIGDEHLLLGLIREGGGVAAQVLAALGVDVARAREEVMRDL